MRLGRSNAREKAMTKDTNLPRSEKSLRLCVRKDCPNELPPGWNMYCPSCCDLIDAMELDKVEAWEECDPPYPDDDDYGFDYSWEV